MRNDLTALMALFLLLIGSNPPPPDLNELCFSEDYTNLKPNWSLMIQIQKNVKVKVLSKFISYNGYIHIITGPIFAIVHLYQPCLNGE